MNFKRVVKWLLFDLKPWIHRSSIPTVYLRSEGDWNAGLKNERSERFCKHSPQDAACPAGSIRAPVGQERERWILLYGTVLVSPSLQMPAASTGGAAQSWATEGERMEGRALGPWDRMGCKSRVPLPGPVLFLLVSSSSSSSSTPLSEALLHSASQAASPACAVPVSSFRGCPRNQRCKAFTSLFWETLLSYSMLMLLYELIVRSFLKRSIIYKNIYVLKGANQPQAGHVTGHADLKSYQIF